MEAQGCLQLLREIKSAAFATVDQYGNPQVRIIDVMVAEQGALYFLTARGKEFYDELVQAGKVAVTAMTTDWRMVRLNGCVKQVDRKWLDRIFEDNPSMHSVYPGESRDILEVFCIESGYGELFDLSGHPIRREAFAFGGAEAPFRGYEISERCIACGTCAQVCPQGCIAEGTPFEITQLHCLHCGRCAENCPEDAIARHTV